MKISLSTNSDRTNFCSKNKNIRYADDIQRRAALSFPMVSESRIYKFYKCDQKGSESYPRTEEIRSRLHEETDAVRKEVKDNMKYETVLFSTAANAMKRTRVGNCSEYATAALYALCANGIYDGVKARLFLDTDIVDKKTGEVVKTDSDTLDHEFVITSLGKYSKDKRHCIILDAWGGFADSYSGAMERFKKFYTKDDIKIITDKNKKMHMIDYYRKNGTYNPDDFEIKTRYTIKPNFDKSVTLINSKIGEYARKHYPELVIKKED